MPLAPKLPPGTTEPEDGTYTADEPPQPEPPDERGDAA